MNTPPPPRYVAAGRKKPDIIAIATGLGLDTTGTAAEIVERLRENLVTLEEQKKTTESAEEEAYTENLS